METIAFCFLALSASIFASPLVDEEKFENDPFGDFSWGDGLNEARLQDVEDRIIGGNETTIQNHPYTISLRYIDRHHCGGSVLTPIRGLTAAHCLIPHAPPTDFVIMAGSTIRKGDENQQLRTLTRFLVHPGFDQPKVFQNDISLLYWEEPLIIGEFVHPIALPPQGTVPDYTQWYNVSGWGRVREGGKRANILKVVSKPLMSIEVCNGTNSYNGRVTSDMICAGLLEGGRDACGGDSGGPLVFNDTLVGVVSWGRGCARPNNPSVYARVSFFTDWILEQL